ncbi:MAG: DUF2522 domain-containing protein [Bacillaceae bacterium]|jgi:hypothetical protein|uniref:Uncharacterized protein n=1 Tax=Aeribacillus pallidus TaxID=33936 RepID=A0A165XHN1_9BACI|nr:sporulation inhibitor of replication protein SirA [Aeribacillus composti]ASS91316.1 hypothetical protein AP3564_14810 [Aeribacillus pallidus]AXI38786.1 DUF2522 domain-containing protein [Bacillaceae bacterium ZC4]REJ19678.1 MAG: DUF2522 domain-containing protein [Bacillaceae bacterium]AXI38854.1 DUF2522 domain-containing protein [Bacillaceae bacterium ZC4]KZM53529.1 hypothetical protein A3Q35_17140 [Aeribacillus pallidus]
MRHFYLYLIKKEFAEHFYHRESKIFQLYQEFFWTRKTHPIFEQLERQVNYISRAIPISEIDLLLQSFLSHRNHYQKVSSIHAIQMENQKGQATMVLKERYIEMICTGSFDGELLFFDILGKFDPYFFAMDFTNERYGWLSPIKERKFV